MTGDLELCVSSVPALALLFGWHETRVRGRGTTTRIRDFPVSFSNIIWKLRAVNVDNIYLFSYDDESNALLEALPTIMELEDTLLYVIHLNATSCCG
ncbi:hypothetical protein F5B21DRAFT_453394 [Xylaria acuta]|nr:hypothetical protein F5B21DRAFT_453394 [Xylaria acuta]